MIERSNVWCTNCQRQFIAELDLALNGNHEITCPFCRHIHYRVVRDGVVTEDRYRSSAGFTYIASTSTAVTISNLVLTSSSTTGALWINRSDMVL